MLAIVLRVDQVIQIAVDGFCCRVAEHLFGLAAPQVDGSIGFGTNDDIVGGDHESPGSRGSLTHDLQG